MAQLYVVPFCLTVKGTRLVLAGDAAEARDNASSDLAFDPTEFTEFFFGDEAIEDIEIKTDVYNASESPLNPTDYGLGPDAPQDDDETDEPDTTAQPEPGSHADTAARNSRLEANEQRKRESLANAEGTAAPSGSTPYNPTADFRPGTPEEAPKGPHTPQSTPPSAGSDGPKSGVK